VASSSRVDVSNARTFLPPPLLFSSVVCCFLTKQELFSHWGARFSTPVQPAPGAHYSYQVSFPAVKEPRRVEHQPHHLTPELSYTSSRLCAVKVYYRANFLKLVPLPAVKTWGCGGIAPLILNFGTKCR